MFVEMQVIFIQQIMLDLWDRWGGEIYDVPQSA